MFLRLAFHPAANLQRTVLILNTVLLIGLLIIFELAYSERLPEKRLQRRYFLPIGLILSEVLIYAVYLQTGNS